MNKKLISIALALSIPLTVLATGDKQADVDKKTGHLTKDLGLNTEQQAKVQAIFEKKEQQKKLLHEEVQTPGQLSLNIRVKLASTPTKKNKTVTNKTRCHFDVGLPKSRQSKHA